MLSYFSLIFVNISFYLQKFNSLRLNESYNILSTSLDNDGLEFISNIEHKKYPVFGTNWHPEKPAYEWRAGLQIPRTEEAVQVNTKLMEMFLRHGEVYLDTTPLYRIFNQ